jgi:formate dehydrogenase major subunit
MINKYLTIISKDFKDTDELDGLFSGWDAEKGRYDSKSWQYEGVEVEAAAGEREMVAGESESRQSGGNAMHEHVDNTLQDPHCVFQIVRRHFSRYSADLVEAICGIDKRLFLRVADELCRNSGRDRTSAFCYAVGWTQHSVRFISPTTANWAVTSRSRLCLPGSRATRNSLRGSGAKRARSHR